MLRIVSPCRSVEQLIAVFRRWCTETRCFLPCAEVAIAAGDHALSIELADGTPVFRGHARVTAVWPTPDNTYARAGIAIALDALDPATSPVFERVRDEASAQSAREQVELLAKALAHARLTQTSPPPALRYLPSFASDDSSRPTVQMSPLPRADSQPIEAVLDGLETCQVIAIPEPATTPTTLGFGPLVRPRRDSAPTG